jgi:membrane protein YdbS with pleckstrin-like domain
MSDAEDQDRWKNGTPEQLLKDAHLLTERFKATHDHSLVPRIQALRQAAHGRSGEAIGNARPQLDSYIRRNLRSGETIILEARITALQLWAAAVISSVLFGPFIIAFVFFSGSEYEPGLFLVALIPVSLFIILPSVYYYFRYKRAELSVTSMRVVEKTGIFSDNVVDTALDRIQNVVYKQPILGKIFGYGTVIIQSAARFGVEGIPNVQKPQEVRDAILQQVELYRQKQIQDQAKAIAESMLRNKTA